MGVTQTGARPGLQKVGGGCPVVLGQNAFGPLPRFGPATGFEKNLSKSQIESGVVRSESFGGDQVGLGRVPPSMVTVVDTASKPKTGLLRRSLDPACQFGHGDFRLRMREKLPCLKSYREQ